MTATGRLHECPDCGKLAHPDQDSARRHRDRLALPIPDGTVDLIVTSPPYFALRSYTDGGRHYAGQVGSEPTPAEYIDALLECTAEMARVVKPEGSIFVNLGDKYGRFGGVDRKERNLDRPGRGSTHQRRPNPRGVSGVTDKSLMLLPERYRIGCADRLGLIVRETLIWSKPNGMPESVTDRCRRSHEDWVHLVKQPRYYSAIDEIREPSNPANLRPSDLIGPGRRDVAKRRAGHGTVGHLRQPIAFHPLGKLPGSVWEIPTEPLRVPEHLGVDHFAAFPTEWPRKIILGWTPPPPGFALRAAKGGVPWLTDPACSEATTTAATAPAAGPQWTAAPQNGRRG